MGALVAAAVAACGPVHDDRIRCEESGGAVVVGHCCAGARPFPDTCAVGACACGPGGPVAALQCQCPDSWCFDGARCVQPPAAE